MEKYYDKISLWGKMFNGLLRLSSLKNNFKNEEVTKKYIERIKDKKYNVPSKMNMKLVDKFNIPVYTFNGNLDKPKDKILLYIHGGSYIEQAVSFQIKFAQKIALETNSTLVMPIYTLAPYGDYKKMYDEIDDIYFDLLGLNKEINILGDSAGGGFCLSFAMYMRDKKFQLPKNILLLSPWVDVSMSNPELRELEKYDVSASIDGNVYAGKLWSRDDSKNWMVSPIYGGFNGINNVSIVVGGKELLKPDCIKLKEKLIEVGSDFNYIEYSNQYHDFGAYPTREGNMVIDDLATIVNGGDINEK